MKKLCLTFIILFVILPAVTVTAQVKTAHNPVIFADVPDVSMIRVGDTYYMSSTTMHMSPGIPIWFRSGKERIVEN
jgi:beta-xylosidase